MSDGEVRRVSRQDIQLVQNLIERCLQLYMNQKEVVATLLEQAKIEPGFTELVWQKLEEENQEFFKAYRVRLVVKQQINIFNKLLEKQVELMSQMGPTGETSMSNSIGSHIPPIPQNSAGYTLALKPENMHPPIGSSIPSTFTNGGSSLHAAVGMSAHAGRMDAPPDMLSTQSSNMGLVQGINVGMIKTEGVYGGSSPFMFGSDGNVLETRPTITDGSVSSFNNMESSSQPLNGSLLDVDSSSFGYLGQIPIPRNFSLSDLTADYSQSSDIFEYPRQPFLDQGDDKRLGSISEGLRYAEFDSDQLNNTSGTT